MRTMFETTAPFYDLRTWAVRYVLGGLAVAGISIALSHSTTGASDAARPAPAPVNTSIWGSDPTTIPSTNDMAGAMRGSDLTSVAYPPPAGR